MSACRPGAPTRGPWISLAVLAVVPAFAVPGRGSPPTFRRAELAGTYGKGSTYWGARLRLLRDGRFELIAGGCTSASASRGRYWFSRGLVRLDPDRGRGAQMFREQLSPDAFLPVRWQRRLYLIADDEVPDFCSAVHNGTEPERKLPDGGFQGLFWLRADGESRRVTSWPELPPKWRPYLVRKPIEGAISHLMPDGLVRANVGSSHGLLPGMLLFDRDAVYYGRDFRVVGVERAAATLKPLQLNGMFSWQPVRIGDRVSTREMVLENLIRAEEEGRSVPNPPPLAYVPPATPAAYAETPPVDQSRTAGLQYVAVALNGMGASAINNRGEIAGWRIERRPTLDLGAARPCIWRAGRVRDLPQVASETGNYPHHLNDQAEVVGDATAIKGEKNTRRLAILWRRGKASVIHARDGYELLSACGISNRGHVVGQAARSGPAHAFRLVRRSFVDLGSFGGASWAKAVNNGGDVVGESEISADGGFRAFLWSRGTLRNLGTLGGDASWAESINDSGEVVGCSLDSVGRKRAYNYHLRAMRELPMPPGFRESQALDINNKGWIVGQAAQDLIKAEEADAVMWRDGKVVRLDSFLPHGSGWDLREAHGINDRGEIIGYGTFRGESQHFVLVPRKSTR